MHLNKFSILLIIIIFFSCSKEKNTNHVATYKGGVISSQDFEKSFVNDYFLGDARLAKKSKLETRINFAKRLALHAIKSKIAKERSLDTTKAYLDYHKKMTLQILKKKIKKKFIDEKYIAFTDKKKAYERYKKKLKGKHLFFPIKSPIDSARILKQAKDILVKLQKGASFTSQHIEEVNQFSNSWIISFTMPYKFEKAIHKLKLNQISDIIHSKWGVHIFQLDSVLSIEKHIGSFNEAKEDIEYGLRKQFADVDSKQKILKKAYFDLFNSCHGKFDDLILDKVLKLVNNNRLNDAVVAYKDSIFLSFGENKVACSVLFGEIKRMSYKYRKKQLESLNDYKYLGLRLSLDKLLGEAVKIKNIVQNISIDDELKLKENLFLSGLLNQLEIVGKCEVSDDEIKDEYAKLIKTPEMYLSARDSITEIYIKYNAGNKKEKQKEIAKIYSQIRKNSDSFDSFLKNNKNSRFKFKRGNLFWVTDIQYSPIGKISKTMKKGEISNIIEGADFFSIIRIEKKQARTLKPFKKIKALIEPKLKNKKIKLRAEEYKNELFDEYNVKVSEEMLLKAFL